MELKGKKAVFLGDSITAGSGIEDKENNIYWQAFGRLSGAVCRGFGIGGHRIARQHAPETAPGRVPYADRVEQMDADADIVVVFGGTNDFGHGDAPLGSFADRTTDTFYGAMHVLCTKLIERYPAAQIVFMTPLHRTSEDDGPFNEYHVRLSTNLEGYVNIITEVCAYYAIPVLDLYRTSGIQPRVPVLRERYMPDGLHPNDAGAALIAQKLYGFLKTL